MYGSLSSEGVYLAAAPEPDSVYQAETPEELAARAYDAAERLDTVEGYEAVVRRFPESIYAELARSRLKRLDEGSTGSATPQTAESDDVLTLDEAKTAYDRSDHAVALKEYRVHAQRGDATAQYMLGVMYREGEAVRWYRLAAKQGNIDAQKALRGRGL